MKRLKWLMSAVLAGVLVTTLWYNVGHSRMDTLSRTRLQLRTPNTLEQRQIAVNNWRYEMRNDGSYFFDVAAGNFGGEFPRGSNYSGVFAAGIWVGALKTGVGGAMDTLNVAQVEFESEYLPGKVMIGTGKDALYRGYIGNIDQYTGEPVINTTAELGELTRDDESSDEYHVFIATSDGTDPTNWPSYAPRLANGSPFVVPGTNAQTYTVFNDLSVELTDFPEFSLAPGYGLEVELESFAFTTGVLANGVFLKASITNKSATNYPGAYLGIWADMDVGSQSSEDLANVDTVRGVAMVYSQTGGSDVHPIAVGLDFLQGPLVQLGEVEDALFNRFFSTPDSANLKVMKFDQSAGILRKLSVKPDSEVTLSATSFTAYPNDPSGNCGQVGNTGDVCRYNYLQGLTATGLPKPKGKYDPYVGATPSDQRVIHSAGPFVLKSGVTQEVWMGFAGGLGTEMGLGGGVPFDSVRSPTPASAVAAMYVTDDAMQKSFNAGLAAPGVPDPPVVTATALPNKVLLTWTNKSELSVDKYGDPELLNISQSTGFNLDYVRNDFQGYRVYKSLTALPDKFSLVAEYDLQDGITEVNDTVANGHITYDIHIGSDNGIRHYFEDEDVVDARTYYYSVTAYDYQPLFRSGAGQTPADIPRTLECGLFGTSNLLSVTPQRPEAGTRGDGRVASFTQTAGWNNNAYSNYVYDKTIRTTLLNPKAVTGRSFHVQVFEFDSTVVDPTWGTRKIVGIPYGTLAFRFIDSASGQVERISNYVDDATTFLDGDGPTGYNGVLDKDSVGNIRPWDAVFEDQYFSFGLFTHDDAGQTVVSPSVAAPIVDGIAFEVSQPTTGLVDIYEVADAGEGIASPQSVLNSFDRDGVWSLRTYNGDGAADGYTTTKAAALTNLARANATQAANSLNRDFEIRFTTEGDTGWTRNAALTGTGDGNIRLPIPFEVWNIGGTLNGSNDPSDDIHMTTKIGERNPPPRNTTSFAYDTAYFSTTSATVLHHFGYTNLIFPTHVPLYDPSLTSTGTTTNTNVAFGYLAFRARIQGGTVEDTIAFQNNRATFLPEAGTVLRVVTKKPFRSGDAWTVRTSASTAFSTGNAKRDMKTIKVVPNPYYGRAFEYQRSLFDKQVKFINLPSECTIRIFTVAGDLVRTLNHAGQSNNNRVNRDPLNTTADFSDPDAQTTSIEVWDLRNRQGSFVASGMYIAVIEAKGSSRSAGKQTVKFAVIQEAIQINGPDNR